MQNKLYLIFVGALTLFMFIFTSLVFSFIYSSYFSTGTKWINWKSILIPILFWVLMFPLYVLWIKNKSKTPDKGKLASTTFMNDNKFKKTFIYVKPGIPYSSSWIIKTQLNIKKEISFYKTKSEGHALVIGSTGSGKTALLLDANIQLFANSTDKPTLIISDPKGELYKKHSQLLKDQGYEVIPINLRDSEESMKWNPLDKIWELWFKDNSSEESKEAAMQELDELTNEPFPSSSGSNAFWTASGATVFQFFAILYLERADENPEELKKEQYNLTNIISNIHQTTEEDLEALVESLNSTSYALMVGGKNVRGKSTTIANILQTVVTTLKIYNDTIVKRVTSSTNFKIDNNKPQAIFIIVPDESTSKYPFISLFISEIYKELINLASSTKDAKLSRRVYFLLDEFGNIPKITQMASMITVARSRNIFFMLLLQGYSQLNEKYGNNTANTIISNCGYEFFLLTSDVDTANKFSRKLGQKSITQTSRSSSSNQRGTSSSSSESERTRNLIHPEDLMKLNFGEYILSMQRENPIKSFLAKTWEWKHVKFGKYDYKVKSNKSYKDNHLKNFINIDEDLSSIQKELPKERKKPKTKTKKKFSIEKFMKEG